MIELRRAAAAESPILAALHAEAFDDPWPSGDIAALIEGLGAVALRADLDGAPAGFILCRSVADEAEVLTLAVAADRRRRGVGVALLEAGALAAAAAGARDLFLEVAEDNVAARRLYARAGFVQVGARPGYYQRQGGSVRGLILRRDLNR